MALDQDKLKGAMKKRIMDSFHTNFQEVSGTTGYDPIVEQWWDKLAEVVSDIALDIVGQIQSDAEVQPGISTQGGDTTSSPGQVK